MFGCFISKQFRLVTPILLFSFVNPALAGWVKESQDIMGTRVTVESWHINDTVASDCNRDVFTNMHRIDLLMSVYKPDSEISRVNSSAAEHAIKVSEELFELIKKADKFSKISQGAFDISFASIGYHYDYRKQQRPEQKTIQKKLHTINYNNLILDNQSIKFSKEGMRIDLGGIAKGHAVDQAIEILQQCGIKQALVSAGGDSRILGNRQGRPWMIGIQHPRDKQAVALSIPLSDTAISTSGDYERYFLSNNERIHHIINPETGKSAKRSWSASVIGPDATSTDALSTSIFILGAKEGLKLINSLDNMDAIIIDSAGVVHYSSGLETPDSNK